MFNNKNKMNKLNKVMLNKEMIKKRKGKIYE